MSKLNKEQLVQYVRSQKQRIKELESIINVLRSSTVSEPTKTTAPENPSAVASTETQPEAECDFAVHNMISNTDQVALLPRFVKIVNRVVSYRSRLLQQRALHTWRYNALLQTMDKLSRDLSTSKANGDALEQR